jgi:DNA-binding beta-propeller fold protein YncE
MSRHNLPLAFVTCLLSGILFASACHDQRPISTEAQLADEEPQFSVIGVEAMRSPIRMALTKREQLLVSDSKSEMILLVDPQTLQATQGLEVEGKPLAVGLLGMRVFVGNVSKRTIEVYSARGGSLQRSFGWGAVGYPIDLAVDDVLGLIFVVDGAARAVKVFDVQGRPRGTISGPGLGIDRLQAPTGIAIDRTRGEVLVSDYGDPGEHASVKIYAYDGSFLAEISGAGTCGMMGCSGGFSRPQGLAVDAQGTIYVADAVLAQVMAYDRETLELLEVIGSRAAGLRLPLDVVVSSGGELYVTSNRTQTVEVFQGVAGQ